MENKDIYGQFSGMEKEQLLKILLQQREQISAAAKEKEEFEKKATSLEKKTETLEKRAAKLEKKNESLEKKNGSLEKKNGELESENAKLREEIRVKTEIIKRMGLEKFLDKSDNANNHKPHSNKSARFSPEKKKEKGKPGRKTGSKNFGGADLEELSKGNDVITNDIKDQYLKEHPGAELVSFGDPDVSYIIEHIKAHFLVHKVVSPKYKTKDGKIIQAPAKSVINHCNMSASSLAYVIAAKYSLGIPVYRMKYLLEGSELDFSTGTIYGWLTRSAELLKPVWEVMKRKLSDGTFPVLNIDETYLRVMEECENSREKCCVYFYSGDNGDIHVRFFDYTGSRKSDNVKEYLKDFKGTIIVDGYSGYTSLESDDIAIQRCQVHGRREFTNITKTMNDEERQQSEAAEVVDLIDVLFEKEAGFKARGLSCEEIGKERASGEYMAAVNAVKAKIDDLDSQVLSEPLRKAVNYYKNGKDRFWTYLKDGRVEMHNNAAERAAKSFATLRRSFLLCRTVKSAGCCAVLTTLTKSAEACGVYPDMYLEWCLNGVRDGRNCEELVPWSPECAGFRMPK